MEPIVYKVAGEYEPFILGSKAQMSRLGMSIVKHNVRVHPSFHHADNLDMLGWNFYMMPELAARGLLMMQQFWNGPIPVENKDKTIRYPDLSKFKIYQQ